MKKTGGSALIALGLLLMAAALLLVGYNLYDASRAQKTAAAAAARLQQAIPAATPAPPDRPAGETEVPDYLLNPEMEMPVQTVDGVDYIGVLSIPALELELPVVSAWSDDGLKLAPCRYSGTAYLDNLVIAGHNYASHFGRLASLTQGDEVRFTDGDGNLFLYTVAARDTLPGTAVEEMEAGEWDLTLFTCTMDGQSRVTIRCERVEPVR